MYENLISQLRRLRAAVPELQTDPAKEDLFEEFLKENEFDLALHVVCDFLLQQKGAVSGAVLDALRSLHSQMGIHDDCLKGLSEGADGQTG